MWSQSGLVSYCMSTAEPFITKIAVRWSDFDQYRHVNNVAYLEFSQEARVDFMMRGLAGAGSMPGSVVRRMEIDYQRALLPDTRFVFVETEILEVGRTSFIIQQSIKDEHGHVAAKLKTVMVMFDVEEAVPVAISAKDRRELERYYAPELTAGGESES